MDKKAYLDSTSNTYAQNNLLKLACVIFGVAAVISSIVSYSALKYHTVVMIPTHLNNKVEISANEADDEYIKSFTIDLMNYALNFNPATVQNNFNKLLLQVDPAMYPTFKTSLDGMMANISKLSISSVFYPAKIHVDPTQKTIEVSGIKKQWSNDSAIFNNMATYTIKYVIVDGRIYVEDLKEK